MKQAPAHNPDDPRSTGPWFIGVLVLPLLVALGIAMGLGPSTEAPEDAPVEVATEDADRQTGRLVVVIVDSLRPQLLADDSLMPSLFSFSRLPETTTLAMTTCKANFSLPCIQTMLEGRQSPFVAGLHNFTGQAGSQASLPGTLAAGGYELAMISDHTLDSLYAPHAKISIDVQKWHGKDHLERDLAAIERSQELLAADEIDVLVLHTVGTDKVAHKDHPGSARYRAHFRAVDQALAPFVDALDLERDSLLIVGDHGHGELGHHTPHSVAIFAGRAYQEMFAQLAPVDAIRQMDLLYFLSYPLLLPVPTSYEGQVYATDHPRGRLADFLEVQRESLEAAGMPEGLGVEEAMATIREKHKKARFDPVFKYAPLLLLFFLFVAQALSALRRETKRDQATRIMLALVAASIPITLVTDADLGLWLCAPILLGAGVAIWRQDTARRDAMRDHLFVALLTVGAAATGLFASDWAHYFHTTGGFQPSIIVFYALLFGAGALLSLQFFASLRRLGSGTLAFAFFVLPSGLYYYQAAQNILLGAFIGAVAVGLWWLAAHPEKRAVLRDQITPALAVSGVITAVSAFFLVWQEAGGWEWHLYAVIWMRRLGTLATLGVLALLFAYWMWAATSAKRRAVVALTGVSLTIICVVLSELPLETLVGSLLPTLFLVGLLDCERRSGLGADRLERDPLPRGLLVAGLVVISLWIATSGFLLQNVDFSFALDWFSSYFEKERDVFLFTFLATLLKYGLPPATIVLALRTVGRREDFRPVVWGAAAFLGMKVFLLLVQIFAGSTAQAEKYHELMISELLFIYPLAIALALLYAAVRLVEAAMARFA